MRSDTVSREHHLHGLTWAAIILTVIGALNWGLVGLFRFNLVAAIFGDASVISRIIYILVALAGVTLIALTPTLRQHMRPTSRAATVGDPTIPAR
jgi:hypothetical protein